MKTVTQEDFRNLYQSPGYEQTEEMRRTLAGLPERKGQGHGTVVRKRRVAFILAAALVLFGITALAVGYYSGVLVTWGAQVKENESPAPTDMLQEDYARMNEWALAVPDDLLAAITSKEYSHTLFKDIIRKVSSPEELAEALDEAGYPHPEQLVPEGWVFSSAALGYGCDPEGRYELVSETAENGLSMEQYRVEEQHRVVAGYSVNLEKGSKKALISAGYTSMIDKFSLGFSSDEGLQARALDVPGMDDALFAEGADGTVLVMYRTLEKPVSFISGPYPLIDAETGEEIYAQEYPYEMILCDGLEAEEAVALFAEAP